MIDIKIIRQNPELVKDSIKKRNLKLNLDDFIELDKRRLEIQKEVEELQAIRNKTSKDIPTISDISEKQKKVAEMKEVGEKIKDLEEKMNETNERYFGMLYSIPNFLSPTAAIGATEDENKIDYVSGEKRIFDFTPKAHYEIGEARGWIDTEKGAEVSGARFWYLKGDLVILQFAIINYVMDFMGKRGFTPVIPPFLVREKAMFGTGFFPAEKSEIYRVNPDEDDLYLIGTSEVPLTSYHMDETIDVTNPIKYLGYSSCFRREAGSYGKDMKGILRGHQFDKLEMVCFCKPEESEKIHDFMVSLEEEIWQSFGIPYQKMNICSGDLGNPAMKKYDLEAWMPAQEKYREVTSCSNVGSFQSRRLNIKYKKDDGSLDFVYTLNGTVIAFSRCLIAIMENFQNEDMTITIPEVLRNYMGGREIL
ncbi:MAG: serine--tRNA ligase [Candidatus Gracilibacteria bacterium]|nr:serine--tRNA ligase [Candidatus Gracilibacteria bacterium]